MTITYAWRGGFDNATLDALHTEGFGGEPAGEPGEESGGAGTGTDWLTQVERHSLGWVTARRGGRLVGFVNVAWDGGTHAFVLDTVVAADSRRSGIGAGLLAAAAAGARAAGCGWLHVDFEEELRAFYFDACGFRPTSAGLIEL